jgi:hypothetical protein
MLIFGRQLGLERLMENIAMAVPRVDDHTLIEKIAEVICKYTDMTESAAYDVAVEIKEVIEADKWSEDIRQVH